MAGDDVRRTKTHRRKHGDTESSRSRKRAQDASDNAKSTTEDATPNKPADVDALRKARLAYLAKDPEQRRKEMKYEYVKRTKSASQVGEKKDKDKEKSKHEDRERRTVKASETGRKRPQRDRSADGYVYSKAERTTTVKSASKEKPKSSPGTSKEVKEKLKHHERRQTEPSRRKTVYVFDEDCKDESKPPQSPATAKSPRVELKRSATTPKAKSEVSTTKASEVASPSKRTSTLFGGLLASKPMPPPKKVSCLTCGDDDVSVNRSALLPCKHRMCNTCLKRIFNMSVTDPAHMPPRCCTDQHIDLKHVEKLFDDKFKTLWNRKFQEYKTKNRVYCPARGCGAWIKPHYISMENGRKVGRCKQCKTRVCGICSQKMHTTRECPKDPETKAFIETAKQKGWQRCYSCHVMVELKEGCNHMTCRCTAEFCMVCGSKWKTCECPWFNYEAVDAHLGDPVRYQQEMDRRRDQVNRDEELARRMQQLGGGGWGLGNGAGHHMNQNFYQQAREALTANYAQANRAARDLLNGFVMGRENPVPGMPLQMDEMLDMLGPGRARDRDRDPAGVGGEEEQRRARRPRGTGRRRTPPRPGPEQDGSGAGMASDEERRMQDWANDAG
jgi:hypothetical protein